jgi:hypothetical protein
MRDGLKDSPQRTSSPGITVGAGMMPEQLVVAEAITTELHETNDARRPLIGRRASREWEI